MALLGERAEADAEFLIDDRSGFAAGQGKAHGLGFELGREGVRAFFGWHGSSRLILT